MKFRFLGTQSNPKEITLRGVTFPKGQGVEVSDPEFIQKLDGLEYFKRQRKAATSEQD